MLRFRKSRTSHGKLERQFPHPRPDDPTGAFKEDSDLILFLFGRTDDTHAAAVRSAFARGILPIALLSKELIVDDGDKRGLAGL